jgi:pimeloyl-ACP methyl ester carboxylesterase/DNA-binding CsgD family transcriptional regulator
MEPVIKYARTSDGVNIAYYSIGEGPTLVYANPGSHLEQEWRHTEQRSWTEQLAANFRLIRFDSRGSGLSDRPQTFTPEGATLDIEAVVARERLNRFALFGLLSSAAIAVLYTCRHPDRVSHLILWSPYARYRDFLESSPQLRALRPAAAIDWHTYTEFLAEFLLGREDIDESRRFAAYLRELWSVEEYLNYMSGFYDLDMTAKLRELAVPVLVVQRKGSAFPNTEMARAVATNAPGARLALLEGTAVSPFLGGTDAGLAAIRHFVSEVPESRPDGLTEREVEILALLSGGASNEQISQELSISTRTVERHIGNIYTKIGAHNRAEATAYAFRRSLVPSP